MSASHATPATVAKAAGYDFNQNTSLEALAAWEEYRKVPLNSGTYTDERDAFTSGFDAAVKGLPLSLAEQVARAADALDALVAVNKTAARIAWTTRPGFRPSGAQVDWIEGEMGL